MTARRKKKPVLPVVAAVIGTALVVLGAVYAWGVLNEVRVSAVTVSGNEHAATGELVARAGIDTTTALLDVRPDTVEARLEEHAWVREASVRRWPTGRVAMRVTERTPVMLVLNRAGEPTLYLDAEGHAMPLVQGAVYDVPVLRGELPALQPGSGVTDRAILSMAEALRTLPREVTALVSDIERRDGELWLRTIPAGEVGALSVRLGRHDMESRLSRLHDFWHQAILTRPERRYAVVDLRFDSQIITRETVINR